MEIDPLLDELLTLEIADPINATQIARRFKFNACCLRRCIELVPDFPPAQLVGRRKIYSRAAVQAWAKGRDVPTLFRQAYRELQAADRYGDTPAEIRIRRLRRDFLAGKFAPPEQQFRYFQKRQIARLSNPPRHIQHLDLEW